MDFISCADKDGFCKSSHNYACCQALVNTKKQLLLVGLPLQVEKRVCLYLFKHKMLHIL